MKPKILEVIDACHQHNRTVVRALNRMSPDFTKEEKEIHKDLKAKFQEWGLADQIDWSEFD